MAGLEIPIFWFHIFLSYYGAMYAISFLIWYIIIKRRGKIVFFASHKVLKNSVLVDNLCFYIFLWVVLWGRVGYVLFYNFFGYLSSPLDILKIWEGGMSFHGGVIWVIIAMIFFCIKYRLHFYSLADEVTAILPIWLWLWRVGNYLNKELLGFGPYDWWFAVYQNGIGYFPSPLLEAVLEWVLLCMILNFVYVKKQFAGQIATLFLILYGIFRIFVEFFFRSPDAHLWYIFAWMSLGFVLSIPMVIVWVFLYWKLSKCSRNIWKPL